MTKEEIISMLSKELNSEWTNGVTCLMVENSDSYIPVIVHHNKNELIVEVGEQDKKIYRMLSDFLLVTDRCTAWKALNGNVSEAEFHNLQQIVLCENQKVSIEKKLASTILLVLMICATAAFVWFTFLV